MLKIIHYNIASFQIKFHDIIFDCYRLVTLIILQIGFTFIVVGSFHGISSVAESTFRAFWCGISKDLYNIAK